MPIRGKLSHKSTLFLLLMVTVTADGLRGAAHASDQAAQNYLRSLTRASDGPEITGTVNTRIALRAGHASLTAVASHARAARAVFSAARAAMERGFLLGETAPKSSVAVLEAAMKELGDHLAIVGSAAKPRSADGVRKASSLAQDWYEAGLKIIKPPVEGVIELPLPMSVYSKADAVSAALDRVIEEAVALAPPPAPAPKRRAQPASRVVADSINPAGAVGRSRDMHY
jgi:hypothetical protein